MRHKALALLLTVAILALSACKITDQAGCGTPVWGAIQPPVTVVPDRTTEVNIPVDLAVLSQARVEISQVRYSYLECNQTFYIMGMMQNAGDLPLVAAGVTLTLTDRDGNVIQAERFKAGGAFLLAGEHSPFHGSAQLPDGAPSWAAFRLGAQARPALRADFNQQQLDGWLQRLPSHSLAVTDSRGTAGVYRSYSVEGHVHNQGSRELEGPHVDVAGYDGSGQLVGVGWGPVEPPTITAGATGVFTAYLEHLAAPVSYYEVFVGP